MAILEIPRWYPIPVKYEGWARNQKIVDWHPMAHAGHSQNFGIAICRKLVFAAQSRGSTIVQGKAGTQTPWRWRCRTGVSPRSGDEVWMRCWVAALPQQGTGTDPKWRFFAGATNSAYVHLTGPDVSSPALNDVVYGYVDIELTQETAYNCGIELEGYARIMSAMAYTYVKPQVDTSLTARVSDPREFFHDMEILDQQYATMIDAQYDMFRKNGAHLLSLVPASDDDLWTTTSATDVNLLDATASTTVGVNTPGFNLQGQYHNPLHKDDVECYFAVYADGPNTGGDDIKLVDENATTLATLSNFGATPTWKEVAFNLDGSVDTLKCDIHYNSDGSNDFNVHAVSVYEWVP